jgi:hypothetical protein
MEVKVENAALSGPSREMLLLQKKARAQSTLFRFLIWLADRYSLPVIESLVGQSGSGLWIVFIFPSSTIKRPLVFCSPSETSPSSCLPNTLLTKRL